jgi:hypothetical protein
MAGLSNGDSAATDCVPLAVGSLDPVVARCCPECVPEFVSGRGAVGYLARCARRSESQISTLVPSRRIQPRWAKSASALLTVSRDAPTSCAISSCVRSWVARVALDQPDPAAAIRAIAPQGVHRIVEVALSDNADLDAAIVANDAVIAAYATRADRPELPFWPMVFNNVTIRLLGSDDFSAEAKQQAAQDLTTAATACALRIEVGQQYPLEQIAQAHDRVDAGGRGRTLVTIPG